MQQLNTELQSVKVRIENALVREQLAGVSTSSITREERGIYQVSLF